MSAKGPLAVKVDSKGEVTIDEEVKALISNILQIPIADRAQKIQELANLLNIAKEIWLGRENYSAEVANIISQALAKNHTISYLNLGFNVIGNAGIRAIADMLIQNTTLRELHVQNNGINDQGLLALAGALKINSSLTDLGIGHNWVTDVGAKALENVLHQNYSLKTIYLGNNEISALQMERIKRTLEDKARIDVQPITYFYLGKFLAKKPVVSDVIATVTSFCTDNLESLQYARLGYLSELEGNRSAEDLRNAYLRMASSEPKAPATLPLAGLRN